MPSYPINREWAMPDSQTFRIKPIRELIERYFDPKQRWLDPFVADSIFKEGCFKTNDLNPKIRADYNLDAEEFLKQFDDDEIDGVFFDPPFSPRQIKECYDSIGLKVFQRDTQHGRYKSAKREIARILKPGGLVIYCGWNTCGMGMKYGFDIVEILLVSHGSEHNDTIITIERLTRDVDLGELERIANRKKPQTFMDIMENPREHS